MKRLSIFVSGNGTNLQRIAEYFANNPEVEIANVVCNNPKAYSIERAKNLGIPLRMITKQDFNSEAFIQELQSLDIDLIVLAGFLWKIPETLVKAFPKRIVNIHPALLPKYGGKGFYGEHVHEAVVAAKEPFQALPSTMSTKYTTAAKSSCKPMSLWTKKKRLTPWRQRSTNWSRRISLWRLNMC